MRTDLTAIAAMCDDRVIGYENRLPWRTIPGDLPRFKKLTTGHVVVMGRKTFESMNSAPLPHRVNLILSRTAPRNCTNTFSDVDSLLRTLSAFGNQKVFVIGGAEVYKLLMPYCNEVLLTVVKGDYNGDTFMPEFEKDFAGYYEEDTAPTHEFRRYLRNAPKNFVRTGSLQEHG